MLTWSAWVQGMACGPPSIDDELQVVDQAGQPLAGLVQRQHLVCVALNHQGRHVDLGQVGAEVGGPGADAGHRGGGRGGDGEVPAGLPGLIADQGAAQSAGVVEVVQEALHPGRGVGRGGLGEPVEQAAGHPVGVVGRLQQVRRDRGDQHSLGHPRPVVPELESTMFPRSVAAQVAGDLPGAHGVPDQHGVAQVEVLQQGVQVGGEGVVVVADGRLAGLAEPAPVVGDHPVPGLQQHRDLLVPGAAAERVPVDQHHRLAGAVILVVDLDVCVVFLSDSHCGHGVSFRVAGMVGVRGAGPGADRFDVQIGMARGGTSSECCPERATEPDALSLVYMG